MPAPRALAIHGHFYQPPRENPWLESVEIQDTAAPYHDWNERVTAECYAPNTAARRVDRENRILDIVNNFEKISFNVGPTLLAWLERHRNDVHARIVEADRVSARARGGHGNAIAQVYNHMIMPLAILRDRATQVRWGLADFRRRFGRDAEGLWLPETAADAASLGVLAEAGVRFTILAPHQAWRVRAPGDEWREVGEAVDPSRPYLWHGPQGQSLVVFFYDGPISRAIAFGDALDRAEHLVARLRNGFSDARAWPQLVHCATDGESYGHHKTFGEMALAAAIRQIEAEGFAALTNHGAFLADHPPTHEVQIRDDTSWSCAHGVDRWRRDCGCRTRSEYHQRWRAPLREALDWLREQVDRLYEPRASAVFKDPWEARDAYIDVILERTPARVAAFLERHQRAPLDAAGRVEAARLLELQRNRLLMYTSCGWFFDEVSGLEPVQILRYAARAVQYMRELGGGTLEPELIRRLEAAPSNVARFRDGADVYRQLVRPSVVDLRRVIAHYAITSLFHDYPAEARVYAYRVRRLDEDAAERNGSALRLAHVRVESDLTGDAREATYALVHFGGLDFACGIRPREDAAAWEGLKADFRRRFGLRSVADLVRALDEYFPHDLHGFQHLFLEERRHVLDHVVRAALRPYEEGSRRVWAATRMLVRPLLDAGAPVPELLKIAARHAIEAEVREEVARVERLGSVPDRVFDLLVEAETLGLPLDLGQVLPAVRAAIALALASLGERLTTERVAAATALVEAASRLGASFPWLWQVQNDFFDLWRARPGSAGALEPLARALGFRLSPPDRA